MDICRLEWDSEFFGLRIGRTDVCSINGLQQLSDMESSIKKEYDLLYVFIHKDINGTLLEWEQQGAMPVDNKTVYIKNVSAKKDDPNVGLYGGIAPDEDLYRLAIASGIYSRFKTDDRMPRGSFERLYNRWIEGSVSGELANAVFVHKDYRVNGLVTVRWDEREATIGLVAVDKDVRGHGIGSRILQTMENYLATHTKTEKISVATQYSNIPARRLYEKNGYTVESITNIYHWWM